MSIVNCLSNCFDFKPNLKSINNQLEIPLENELSSLTDSNNHSERALSPIDGSLSVVEQKDINREILEMESDFEKSLHPEAAYTNQEKVRLINEKFTKLGFNEPQIKVLNSLFTQERLRHILHFVPKHQLKLKSKLDSDTCEDILKLYKEKTMKCLEEREIGKDRKYDFKRLPESRPQYVKMGSAIASGIGAVAFGTFFPGSTPSVILNMAIGQEVKARLKKSTIVKSVLFLTPLTLAAGALVYFYPQYALVNAIAGLAATPGALFIKGAMRAISNDFYLEPPLDEERHKIAEDISNVIRESQKKSKKLEQKTNLSDE
jgi:hypothetical protein